jgi:putative chitinase
MNTTAFFDHVRAKLGRLSQLQVEGFEAVLKAIEGAPLSHKAYMLATAWHETAHTMQPVREAFGLSENWRKRNLRYYPFYGRGYVQTTHKSNYARLDAAAAKAGLIKAGDIMANLDLAMRPDIAAMALREGMEEGWYDADGKKMAQRLPMQGVATKEQYIKARRLVNVNDKADLIEDYAQAFERALRAAFA